MTRDHLDGDLRKHVRQRTWKSGVVRGDCRSVSRSTAGYTFEDRGNISEQIDPSACKLAELGHRGVLLVLGQLAPSSMVQRGPGELDDDAAPGPTSLAPGSRQAAPRRSALASAPSPELPGAKGERPLAAGNGAHRWNWMQG